jgi:hypothetical protein
MRDTQVIGSSKVAEQSGRRRFLRNVGALGAMAGVAAIGGTEPAAASDDLKPLWNSAMVFIGNSLADQSPSPSITCPMYFANGAFANASHSLDLSRLPTTGQVIGTFTYQNNTIQPDFGASIAATVAQGSDGIPYLLVAGEGTVSGGAGYFAGVTKAIIRCKYKISGGPSLLLIACIDCVQILVRK